MTVQTSDLVTQALGLPLSEQNLLVEQLLENMYSDQNDIDEAWRIEVRRRVEEYRTGNAELIPGEQVFAEVRERFGK